MLSYGGKTRISSLGSATLKTISEYFHKLTLDLKLLRLGGDS